MNPGEGGSAPSQISRRSAGIDFRFIAEQNGEIIAAT
jgi:hypothetical protein